MATMGGAATPPYGSHIGTLAVGKAADLVLFDWDKLAYPYLDPETPVLDAVLQRGKTEGVDLVMVAGEVIYEGGRFTRVDRTAVLRELHESLLDRFLDQLGPRGLVLDQDDIGIEGLGLLEHRALQFGILHALAQYVQQIKVLAGDAPARR
jgi:hypothetical protein